MGCLGVHYSLDEKLVRKLRAFRTDSDRLEYLQEEIEERFAEAHTDWYADTDKAWDAMHRALTDGQLAWDNGTYPLNHVILGGELLYTEDDYIMSLKTPVQVNDITASLSGVTHSDFRRGYFRIRPAEYGFDLTEEDFEYTWDWFERLRPFYSRAATDGRYVLFTASQ